MVRRVAAMRGGAAAEVDAVLRREVEVAALCVGSHEHELEAVDGDHDHDQPLPYLVLVDE